MFRIHDLHENHSDGEHFVILAILQVEKRWAKVSTSTIAYPPIVSAHFQIWTRPIIKLPLCTE